MSENKDQSENLDSSHCSSSLVDRLRGIYTVGDKFRRKFDGLPPINEEAAQRIEELEAVLRAILKHQTRLQRRIKLAENALR